MKADRGSVDAPGCHECDWSRIRNDKSLAPCGRLSLGGCIVRQNPVQYCLGVFAAMPQQASRTARIEARIAPDALRVVRRAAELQGRSISDFVVAAAQEAAHRTIDQAQVIHLSVEDQQRFVELLLNPPVLAPALKRAKKAHARLIASSR